MFEKQLPFLREGELPGPKYWNMVIRFLRRITSRSSRLVLNERPGGGIYIDLADESSSTGETLDFSFKASVSGSSVTIAAGSVRLPGSVISVSSRTFNGSSNAYAWVRVASTSSASIQIGNSFPNVIDAYNQYVNVPLGYYGSGQWHYRHMADIVIPAMPYFWINGFTANAAQSLDHDTSGNMVWTTYGDCPAAEE